MCTDDTARALTRARDAMELCLVKAKDFVETAAFAVSHANGDLPPAAIAGTLSAAVAAISEAEEAARQIAELARPPAPAAMLQTGATRH